MGKKHFCFFQTAETGNRTPNSDVKGSGANHYPRAPAPGAFVPRQNSIQLIGSNERIIGNIPEHILHRSHNRDQIITFIKDTKSRASCECFTLILQIYVPIQLHHVLRENNEHLITSNQQEKFFFY